MKKEEVIKWLKIMKANLNTFPEINCGKKIEALAEAIRLLKNEQSIDKIDCDHTNCINCVNHKYCDYETTSSGKPNKSEIPTGSDDCISREQALVAIRNLYPDMPRVDFNGSLRKWVDKYKPYIECDDAIELLPSVTPIRPKGHWIYDKNFANWICSKCGETPKTIGYVGPGTFMAEHFKYCNHCGADMREVKK